MTRTIDVRFVVTRDGSDYCELYPNKSAPFIQMTGSNSIKTTLSGEFVQDKKIDWLRDKIRPELIIDGVVYPLGIYLPVSVRKKENETSKTVQVDAYDQCWQVQDVRTEGILHLDSGTNYIEAIKQLLGNAGIVIVIATPTTATLANDREDWEPGSSYLDIINQLLDEINYNPLWFNPSGAAILEPNSVPTVANIEHTINSDDVKSLMLPSVSSEIDIFNSPNVFVCVCSNPDNSSVMTATAENTNPQSPLSIARRGRRIVHVEKVDNIASQTELQAYAERMRNESMITGETWSIQTALQPGHGVNDVVAFHHEDETSICIERAWSMTLMTGGIMTHTLEKVVYNLG